MSESIRDLDDNITQNYDIKKRVGKGAYGIVWKAVDKRTQKTVAIKKIFDAFRNQTDAQRTYREIVFLRELMWHPNIVRLHGVMRAANDKDIYLVFEYMETDLHNVIKHGNILREIHKQSITYQLLKAIKYIHSGNIIHRDLKPCNILINSQCHCKVADFGLARSVLATEAGHSPSVDPAMTDYVATRWYRAPEILVASKKYTKGIDMWSIGCILAEMVLGKPLFPGSSTVNQVEKIMSTIPQPTSSDVANVCPGYGGSLLQRMPSGPCIPLALLLRNASEDCVDLVCRLLVFNPYKRLTAVQALKHPYVAKFHDSTQEFAMNRSVIPSLSDNVQLSIEEYRDKLYELMSSNNKDKALNATTDLSRIYDWYRSISQSKNDIKSSKKSNMNKNQEEFSRKQTDGSFSRKSQWTTTSQLQHDNQQDSDLLQNRRGSESSSKSITSTGHSQAGSGSITKSYPANQNRHKKNSDPNRKMPTVTADVKPISSSAADVKAVMSSMNVKTNQRNRNEPIRDVNVKHIGVAENLAVKLVTVSTSHKPAAKSMQHVNFFRRSSSSDNDVDRHHSNHKNHVLNRSKTLSHDSSKIDVNRTKNMDKMSIANSRFSKFPINDGSPIKKRTAIERQTSLSLVPTYKPKCGYISESQLKEISQVVR